MIIDRNSLTDSELWDVWAARSYPDVYYYSPSGEFVHLYGWLVVSGGSGWTPRYKKYLKRRGVLIFRNADKLIEELFPGSERMTVHEQRKAFGYVMSVSCNNFSIFTNRKVRKVKCL